MTEELQKILNIHTQARSLLIQHGLAQEGWTFKLSNTKNAAGRCRHTLKQIEFSKWFINSPPEKITDVLLHEIAHALVGPKYGHGGIWKAKAREVGADPTRLVENAVSTARYNFVIRCPKCGWQTFRYRLRNSLFMKDGSFRGRCPKCNTRLKAYNLVHS